MEKRKDIKKIRVRRKDYNEVKTGANPLILIGKDYAWKVLGVIGKIQPISENRGVVFHGPRNIEFTSIFCKPITKPVMRIETDIEDRFKIRTIIYFK